jgi:hypothetical protein
MRKVVFQVLLLISTLGACSFPKTETIELQQIEFPGTSNSSLPSLSSSPDGLILSWVSKPNDSTAQLLFSRFDGTNWAVPKLVTQGKDWFVNWADFPAVVENKGNLLGHILQKSSPATFSYDVRLQVLQKGEPDWKTNLPLHTDSTLTEHGFVSSVAFTESSFFVSWLDGRNTGGAGHDHAAHSGAMSIRVAEVSVDGRVLWDELLDAKTCDCCQTSSAITSKGPIVIYRNRSDREIRDIAITRLVHGKWTEPRIIHEDGWEIAGCPVNGPKVSARGETVLVGWFTASGKRPQVKFAFSRDSGESFGKPIVLDSEGIIGRVDVALLDDRSGLVSWIETKEGMTFLYAARVDLEGKVGVVVPITEIDPSRKSGFPQMEVFKGRVYFAWTDVQKEGTKISTSFLKIEEFESK